MVEIKAFKFRIYPDDKQKEFIHNSVRTSNFIFNYSLRQQIDISDKMTELGIVDKAERKKYMKDNDLYFNKFNMSRNLTQMGNTEEFSFLKEVDSTSKSYALRGIDNAFKNMVKMGSGFPKFKNMSKSTYSFTGQIQYIENKIKSLGIIKTNNAKVINLNLPKLKKVKCVCHLPIFIENYDNSNIIKVNSYTISRKGNNYYISFQVEHNQPHLPEPIKHEINEKTSIGIDMGVQRPITTSNEIDFNLKLFNERFDILLKHKEELHKLSAILNRKRDYHKKNKSEIKFHETSAYKRISKKLKGIHHKIANIRENLQHNITSNLVNRENINTFILEELQIKNMTKRSAKGKSNKKSNLNRVMLDVGMHGIRTKLTYKAEKLGKNVETVNPRHTSQKCSNCGHINKLNRKSQESFICCVCGFTINADLNAAINIKNNFFNNNP